MYGDELFGRLENGEEIKFILLINMLNVQY